MTTQSDRKPPHYLSTPDSIQQRTDITATEKDILSVIARRQGRLATATLTQAEIAKQAGIDLKTVSRSVGKLKAKGLLKVLNRTRRTPDGRIERLANIYSVTYITERNLRWKYFDRSQEAAEKQAESRGKLLRLPLPPK